MYCRDRLQEAGGFDEQLRGSEDYDLFFRLARRYPVASRTDRIAEYRLHGANTSRNVPLMLETALRVLRRESRHLGRNIRRKRALAIGLHNCKSYYVQAQLHQAVAAAKGSGIRRIPLRATARVFARAPGTFARLFCRRILKLLPSPLLRVRSNSAGVEES